MKIIGKDKLVKFAVGHSSARKPIKLWLRKTENADWKNASDVKATFPTVDSPKSNEYIFNIGGNNFRLVALVVIKNGVVIVEKIMTHADYDKWNKRKK